jgi:hypothetical protein
MRSTTGGLNMGFTTKLGYEVSEENYNAIKAICPDLSFEEVLRMVDLFKTNQI